MIVRPRKTVLNERETEQVRKLRYMLLLAILMLAAPPLCRAAATVPVIRINDPITPVIGEYISRNIDRAVEADAPCLVIQLDTPGGLDLAMRDIIKDIMASPVPVVVYVAPSGARAASAGALITIAAHVAAMAPGTNIGAAHPVSLGGGKMDEDMAAKIENDAAAYIESIAVKRKRNSEWAITAVRESVSISEDEARKLNVIDLIVPTIPDLLREIDGRTVETASGTLTLQTAGAAVQYHEMGLRDTILKALANPNIAYILFLAGLAGLYFEFSNPGAIFPGVIGGMSLILAFYSMQTLSASYAGVLLILLGLVLFILEIKITSFGLLTIGGIVSLTLGSLMLFDSPAPYMRVSLSVIVPTVAVVSAVCVLAVYLVIRGQRRQVTTGTEGLIGMRGTARSDIGASGKVFVHGEFWNAWSDTPVVAGAPVRVISVDGMTLKVEADLQNSGA